MQEIIRQIIKDRQQKKPKISESLAKLEEDLFQAKQQGNTRKIKAIESVIRAIKNKKGHRN